jgi:hypothetical protein
LAAVFLAGAFLAVDDEALVFDAVFLAGDVLAVVFFAVVLAAVFLAGDVVAAVFFAVVLAALFLAVVAVDFFAALVVVVFLAGDFVAAFLADVPLGAVVFFAGAFDAPPAAAFAVLVAASNVSLGSFLAPDTTAFSSAPALNLGTAVFFALRRSPVRGLRTHLASRTRFSNDPKPVMATFSPRATSRVIVSITASRAWAACLRFPS